MGLRLATSYTHQQDVASTEWTINHNMNQIPSVAVFIQFEGKMRTVLPSQVEAVDSNTIIVRFTAAQSGIARLV